MGKDNNHHQQKISRSIWWCEKYIRRERTYMHTYPGHGKQTCMQVSQTNITMHERARERDSEQLTDGVMLYCTVL